MTERGRLNLVSGLRQLVEAIRRRHRACQYTGAHQGDDLTEQAQHAEDALLQDPLGQPEALDRLLAADERARIERDRLVRQGAVQEQTPLRRAARDGRAGAMKAPASSR